MSANDEVTDEPGVECIDLGDPLHSVTECEKNDTAILPLSDRTEFEEADSQGRSRQKKNVKIKRVLESISGLVQGVQEPSGLHKRKISGTASINMCPSNFFYYYRFIAWSI